MLSLVAVGRLKRTNCLSIDCPNERCWTPIKRVGMKLCLGGVHQRLGATIIISNNTFPEVVGLDLATRGGKVVSRPLPVNFVLVV